MTKITNKLSFLMLIIFLIAFNMNAQKIKVACVGNSVTYGSGIDNREINSYPAQLQKLLGNTYDVRNFGHSGATMLKNGHKPYWKKPEFQKSKEFVPNIVIIHLGLNDQGLNNWPKHKDEFEDNYIEMIEQYKNLPSKPKILICNLSPTFSGHHWFEEGMRENFIEIQAKIVKISEKARVEIIDLNDPLYRFPELLPDSLHPTKEGAGILAQKSYSHITGDYGGLQLPRLYGEQMVIQRYEPIVISGIADAGDQIKVKLNEKKAQIIVQNNGNWSVTFPIMEAGGPYKLSIKSELSNDILINKVFIGEVWLASGQSNMDFKVSQLINAGTVLKDSINDNIFLFSLDGNVLTDKQFTTKELSYCNASDYFKSSGWSNKNNAVLENFSAVAYSFAYNLQKELNIPIGIICNAIGGSPTQSWISRESMEKQHETIDLLNDTWMNPMVDSWVSKRKVQNFEGTQKLGIKARHPYDPTFLFDAGIQPIIDYNIKGVIWYQGESNAEKIELHSKLFKMLVEDWRMHFKNHEMPFYFVQLSSINRSTWGHFRNAQRRLLSIQNTAMAVSSDAGHPTDVHPKRKWIIGNRLSKIALAKNYDKNIPFSGPLLDFVNVKSDTLKVHFKFDEGLKTVNGSSVKDLQIAGSNEVFVDATSKIKDNVLYVWSPALKNPRFVKYGFTPYTEGNLINKFGLPASTFANNLE